MGQSLIKAVAAGNVKKVQAAIEKGADVNATADKTFKVGQTFIIEGDTLLHAAFCKSQNTECVRVLINAGADVNMLDSRLESPLFLAVKEINIECVKLLLDAGADVNRVARIRDLPNWFRSSVKMETKIRCMQLLLTKETLVNTANSFCRPALESFLSFLGDTKNAEKGVRLLVAAGERGQREYDSTAEDDDDYVQIKPREISLRNECREAIRRHLLSINNINLFVRVPQLPLPAALKSYLLYYVTLDEDYVTNDAINDVDAFPGRVEPQGCQHLHQVYVIKSGVSDDVDFFCEKLLVPQFEGWARRPIAVGGRRSKGKGVRRPMVYD